MALLPAGAYKAKPLDWSITESKTGNVMAVVQLELVDHPNKLTWRGAFTPKATPHTLKALATMGLEKDPFELSKGFVGEALRADKVVEITVEIETNPNDGKQYNKVQWVNSIFTNKFSSLASESAVIKMKGMNLMGELAAVRAELGLKSEPKTVVATDEEPLPF